MSVTFALSPCNEIAVQHCDFLWRERLRTLWGSGVWRRKIVGKGRVTPPVEETGSGTRFLHLRRGFGGLEPVLPADISGISTPQIRPVAPVYGLDAGGCAAGGGAIRPWPDRTVQWRFQSDARGIGEGHAGSGLARWLGAVRALPGSRPGGEWRLGLVQAARNNSVDETLAPATQISAAGSSIYVANLSRIRVRASDPRQRHGGARQGLLAKFHMSVRSCR